MPGTRAEFGWVKHEVEAAVGHVALFSKTLYDGPEILQYWVQFYMWPEVGQSAPSLLEGPGR